MIKSKDEVGEMLLNSSIGIKTKTLRAEDDALSDITTLSELNRRSEEKARQEQLKTNKFDPHEHCAEEPNRDTGVNLRYGSTCCETHKKMHSMISELGVGARKMVKTRKEQDRLEQREQMERSKKLREEKASAVAKGVMIQKMLEIMKVEDPRKPFRFKGVFDPEVVR